MDIQGSIVGFVEGDTRSVDYGSYGSVHRRAYALIRRVNVSFYCRYRSENWGTTSGSSDNTKSSVVAVYGGSRLMETPSI